MKISSQTSGVFAIAPTPFLPDGTVDERSIDRMVAFYEEAGCDGITILGIMGEAPKLEAEEALAIVRRVIGRTRLPVIVGVSAAGLAAMRRLARFSADCGAAGVMVAPTASLRSDDQVVGYYGQVVEAIGSDIALVVQDYPLTTNVVMTPGVIARIVADLPSAVMLKHEDWPGLEKISALRSFERAGEMRRISILCGNGGLFLDFECARGADGAMTGYAFPEMLVDVVRLSRAGERNAAQDVFDAHLPLVRYEQQLGVGLAVRKYILRQRGAIAHETQRTPRAVLSEAARAEVDYLVARLAARWKAGR